MKKVFFLLTVVAAVCFISACGPSRVQKATPTPTPTPERSAAVNSPVDPAAGPISSTKGSAVNSGAPTIINTNSNVIIANVPSMSDTGGPPPANGPGERLRGRSRQRQRIVEDPSATPVPMTFQKAPENSEFAAYMNTDGSVAEMRVFKNHPQLQKVEMIWTGPQNKILKVTLKNGKIVERKEVRIANVRTVSSAEILDIIGVKAAAGPKP